MNTHNAPFNTHRNTRARAQTHNLTWESYILLGSYLIMSYAFLCYELPISHLLFNFLYFILCLCRSIVVTIYQQMSYTFLRLVVAVHFHAVLFVWFPQGWMHLTIYSNGIVELAPTRHCMQHAIPTCVVSVA